LLCSRYWPKLAAAGFRPASGSKNTTVSLRALLIVAGWSLSPDITGSHCPFGASSPTTNAAIPAAIAHIASAK